MNDLRIVPTRDNISSCSICYARNYEPQQRNSLGKYKPLLFDLHVGSQVMCLCPECAKSLSELVGRVVDASTSPSRILTGNE